jgi:hypothetical protein
MTDYMDEIDWTAAPKRWRDMTPEEKGALLLAHHEGKVIEGRMFDEWHQANWQGCASPTPSVAYRIRPEPKRETVRLYGQSEWGYWNNVSTILDTHRITFDLIDCEPDCASVKMERIK